MAKGTPRAFPTADRGPTGWLVEKHHAPMAESPSGGEKSEYPTPKRLEEARLDGQVSFSAEVNIASLLLILQYLVGIGLLASGARNQAIHYALAVLVLVPIGLEHGLIRRRFQGRQLAVNLTAVAAVTTVVIFITYLIGRGSAAG